MILIPHPRIQPFKILQLLIQTIQSQNGIGLVDYNMLLSNANGIRKWAIASALAIFVGGMLYIYSTEQN